MPFYSLMIERILQNDANKQQQRRVYLAITNQMFRQKKSSKSLEQNGSHTN